MLSTLNKELLLHYSEQACSRLFLKPQLLWSSGSTTARSAASLNHLTMCLADNIASGVAGCLQHPKRNWEVGQHQDRHGR